MAIIIVVGSDNMYGQTVNTDDIEDIDLSATVSNTVPQVNLSNQIPDITLTLGQLPYTRTLGAAPLIFKDQEEDILQYSVSSSDPATLQAYIIDNVLQLEPMASGRSTVTLSAGDGHPCVDIETGSPAGIWQFTDPEGQVSILSLTINGLFTFSSDEGCKLEFCSGTWQTEEGILLITSEVGTQTKTVPFNRSFDTLTLDRTDKASQIFTLDGSVDRACQAQNTFEVVVQEEVQFTIPHIGLEQLPQVDANLDDWQELFAQPLLTNMHFSSLTGQVLGEMPADDQNVEVWLGWNEQTNLIYIAARVQDDAFGTTSLSSAVNVWRSDDIEIYLDADHSGGFYAAADLQAQEYVLNPAGKWGAVLFPLITVDDGVNSTAPALVEYKVQRKDTTYYYELAVPGWNGLGFTDTERHIFTADEVIGLGVMFADFEDEIAADNRVHHAHNGLNGAWQAWRDADQLVDFRLGEVAANPMPDEKLEPGSIALDGNISEGDQKQRKITGIVPGQIVTLQLNIMDAPEITGWSATIEFDPSQVQIVNGSFSASGFIPGLLALSSGSENSFEVGGTVLGSNASNAGDGTLGGFSVELLADFSEETAVRIVEVQLRLADGGSQTLEAYAELVIVSDKVLLGDFDGDNEVEYDDFFIFADLFGSADPDADFDGDGTVGYADFFFFADQFGKVKEAG